MQGLGPAACIPLHFVRLTANLVMGVGSREALGSSAAEQANKRPPIMPGHTWKGVMANTSDLSAARTGGIRGIELPSDPRRLPSPCVWRRLVPAMAALTCPSPSPVPALTRDPRAPAADEVPDENCVPPGPYLRCQRGVLTLCLMTAAAYASSCAAAITETASGAWPCASMTAETPWSCPAQTALHSTPLHIGLQPQHTQACR